MEDDIKYVIREDGESILDLKSIINTTNRYRWKILVISLSLGLLVGAFNLIQKKYYVTYSALSSTLFATNEMMPHLNTLTGMAGTRNFYDLSRELQMTNSEAESILGLDFNRATTDDGMFTCDLVITTTDTNLVDKIQDAIIMNLQSNSYLKNRYDSKKLSLESLYEQSLKELAALDELKESTKGLDEKVQKGLVVYPLNIHSEIMSLSEKSARIKESIDRLSIASYLRRANIPKKPNGPRVLLNTLGALVTGAIFGLMFFVFRDIFK
ncbi:hypothetical protein OAA53_01620 [Salibacteraceae bacterium]|nr:hypothetical protein [Salibacteraceae bacterium]